MPPTEVSPEAVALDVQHIVAEVYPEEAVALDVEDIVAEVYPEAVALDVEHSGAEVFSPSQHSTHEGPTPELRGRQFQR